MNNYGYRRLLSMMENIGMINLFWNRWEYVFEEKLLVFYVFFLFFNIKVIFMVCMCINISKVIVS